MKNFLNISDLSSAEAGPILVRFESACSSASVEDNARATDASGAMLGNEAATQTTPPEEGPRAAGETMQGANTQPSDMVAEHTDPQPAAATIAAAAEPNTQPTAEKRDPQVEELIAMVAKLNAAMEQQTQALEKQTQAHAAAMAKQKEDFDAMRPCLPENHPRASRFR